jgi:hypothetical protein
MIDMKRGCTVAYEELKENLAAKDSAKKGATWKGQ